MVVKLLLQGMKPARFRDAVKQQLAWEDGDSNSPSKLKAIMDAQLDEFEAAEEILGVHIRNAVSYRSRRTKDSAKTLDEWGRRRLVKERGANHV